MNNPIFISPEGKEYKCLFYASGFPKCTWEWYGFEEEMKEGSDVIYFGYVMGFENEFGSFSTRELKDSGIIGTTDIKELKELMPPIGWTRKEV